VIKVYFIIIYREESVSKLIIFDKNIGPECGGKNRFVHDTWKQSPK